MKMKQMMLFGVVAAVSLAGCQTMQEGTTLAPEFGNAVKTNNATQTVNPEAGRAEQPAPPLDGQRGELALKQYRKDKGEAPAERLLIDIGSGN